jgi:hypothetical protein
MTSRSRSKLAQADDFYRTRGVGDGEEYLCSEYFYVVIDQSRTHGRDWNTNEDKRHDVTRFHEI